MQEARLYAPSELVVTKNQSLAEFQDGQKYLGGPAYRGVFSLVQDKLTERFKGLLKGGEGALVQGTGRDRRGVTQWSLVLVAPSHPLGFFSFLAF